ncbi:MAG: VOC family protein [Burkholderiales bacterium]|nr:VOC family protein [Burkholderiales bacterium]
MKSPWIQALRSVALTVPDLVAAEAFYTRVWHLEIAARAAGVVYFRGSGADHHLLALHQRAGVPQILAVTLRARERAALAAIGGAAVAAGGVVEQPVAAASDPAGGVRVVIKDPDGRRFEIVHGDARRTPDPAPPRDQPQRLAHAVLNSHDVASTQAFMERALGFVLADRTKIMAFMNCDVDHHSIALGDADNDALNHIAFVMPTPDAVMRGGGRMKDAGHAIEWGPGRHGPGDNAFNYFIDPFGIVIEYTAEVEQIDDSHRARGPADWTWPPGRVDQWGISAPPSARLKEAQRAVLFSPSL